MIRSTTFAALVSILILSAFTLLGNGVAWGHCDTMDGPVIADAKTALEAGDVAAALKWVQPDKEDELRQAFHKTLTVRSKGPEAKELADMYFFETLVRIHRQGEGAPYTGVKPAGTPLEPGVRESDEALASGDAEALVKATTDMVAAGIRQRFAQAAEAQKHANHNVQAGRKYVAAYVEFVHYVERIVADAKGSAHAHGDADKAAPQPAHPHEEAPRAAASEHVH